MGEHYFISYFILFIPFHIKIKVDVYIPWKIKSKHVENKRRNNKAACRSGNMSQLRWCRTSWRRTCMFTEESCLSNRRDNRLLCPSWASGTSGGSETVRKPWICFLPTSEGPLDSTWRHKDLILRNTPLKLRSASMCPVEGAALLLRFYLKSKLHADWNTQGGGGGFHALQNHDVLFFFSSIFYYIDIILHFPTFTIKHEHPG